jgi:hypothetical protein
MRPNPPNDERKPDGDGAARAFAEHRAEVTVMRRAMEIRRHQEFGAAGLFAFDRATGAGSCAANIASIRKAALG